MSEWVSKGDYDTKILATPNDLNAEGVEIQLVRFRQGKFAHFHKKKTEFFHFMSGSGKVLVEGQTQILTPGVSLLIRPGVTHTFINESENELLEGIMVKTNNDPADTYRADEF